MERKREAKERQFWGAAESMVGIRKQSPRPGTALQALQSSRVAYTGTCPGSGCWAWLTHTLTVTFCFPDLEAPEFQEVPSVDGGGSHPSELHTPAAIFQGPEEKPLLDRASESS